MDSGPFYMASGLSHIMSGQWSLPHYGMDSVLSKILTLAVVFPILCHGQGYLPYCAIVKVKVKVKLVVKVVVMVVVAVGKRQTTIKKIPHTGDRESRPMRIDGPILFYVGCVIYLLFFNTLNSL